MSDKLWLDCECTDTDHSIRIVKYEDEVTGTEYYVSIHHRARSFATRLKKAFSMLVRGKCGYSDDTLLTQDSMNKLVDFINASPSARE